MEDAHVRPRGRRVCKWFALVVAFGWFSLGPGAWERPDASQRVPGVLEAAPDRRTAPVRALAFASGGRELLTAGDSVLNVWSLPGAERVRALRIGLAAVHDLAVSSDGAVVAIGGGSPGKSGVVQLWDWPAARPRPPIMTRTDAVTAIAFRPDGECVAAANVDGAVRVYSVALGVLRYTVMGHRGGAWAVAFSPDSRVLATGGSDRTIKLWDATNGDLLRTLAGHSDAVRALCFSPRGEWLASGGADRTVRIWQYGAGRLEHTVGGLDGEVLALAYRADGGRLVAATADGAVRVIDVTNVALGRTLRPKLGEARGEGRVSAVALHPDAETLAVGQADGTASVWDARTGRLIAVVPSAAAP